MDEQTRQADEEKERSRRELEAKVRALQADHVEQVRSNRRLRQELLRHAAAGLLAVAPRLVDGTTVVVHKLGEDCQAGDLKVLSDALLAQPRVVFLGGTTGEKATLLFARGPECTHDMAAILKASVASLGGKGGGTAQQAQGGLPALHLDSALAAALALVQAGADAGAP